MPSEIIYKDELNQIIEYYKKHSKYSAISKKLNRTVPFVRNELFKFITSEYANGSSMYKISQEFNLSLDKVKKIVTTTKPSDIIYMTLDQVIQILELLKQGATYNEICDQFNTTKDIVISYTKRYVNDQLCSGKTSYDIKKEYGAQISKVMIKKKSSIQKTPKLSDLISENTKLKQELQVLKKSVS